MDGAERRHGAGVVGARARRAGTGGPPGSRARLTELAITLGDSGTGDGDRIDALLAEALSVAGRLGDAMELAACKLACVEMAIAAAISRSGPAA